MSVEPTWFEELFGFDERKYLRYSENGGAVRRCFRASIGQDDNVTLVAIKNSRPFTAGRFEAPSLAALRAMVFATERAQHMAKYPKARMTLSHLSDTDVGTLIRDPIKARNAVFQVASQFNALEMARPRNTPGMGVTMYEHDRTQGPACALACPAATVYRNYFVENPNGGRGQCGDPSNQLDLLDGMAAALHDYKQARDPHSLQKTHAFWYMQNGYAFPTSAAKYTELCGMLNAMDNDECDKIMAALRCAIQWDTSVDGAPHLVTQVFCSALPLAYAPDLFVDAKRRNDAWPKLILQGAYEFTLLVAGLAAMQRKERVTCYITQLGGGAFGNDDRWVRNAVFAAIDKYYFIPVDVVMVHYESDIPEIYLNKT